MQFTKIAVIGAGTMGNGIAQIASMAGFTVALNDIKDEFLAKAESTIEGSLDRLIKKGKLSQDDQKSILERIHCTTNLEKAVSGADIIIEAVLENIDLKKDIFRVIDGFKKPDSILASNTSQYSITEIAEVVSDPSRVVGLHFFNPPVMMRLIEVVRGLETSDSVIDQVLAFAERLRKEVVVCKDSQGFISTRVLMALRAECYRILEEGVASKEDIDKTLKLAFGHPMGQFELADFSGLDIEIPIFESLTGIFGDRFRPPQNIRHLVKAGRIGRKSGRGWYDYTK